MNSGTISLFTLHTLDVDDVLLSVHLDNLANLLAFVVSPDDLFIKTNIVELLYSQQINKFNWTNNRLSVQLHLLYL